MGKRVPLSNPLYFRVFSTTPWRGPVLRHRKPPTPYDAGLRWYHLHTCTKAGAVGRLEEVDMGAPLDLTMAGQVVVTNTFQQGVPSEKKKKKLP